MAAYDAFLVCGPRDFFDLLSAVGPTIAAGVAVAVAIWQAVVSHVMLKRERKRTAPRISIQKGVGTTRGVPDISLVLQNTGETRAIVETLELAVDGEPF